MIQENGSQHWSPAVMSWSLVPLIVALFVVGCRESRPDGGEKGTTDLTVPPDTMTISRVLRTDDRFSTLTATLDSTGLDSVLAADGPYTLFAPPNEAFARLPDGTLEVLLGERRERLRTILAHHASTGRHGTATLDTASALRTLSGDSLRLQRDSTLRVGGATVVEGDIPAANGIIHVLDRVLPPPASNEE